MLLVEVDVVGLQALQAGLDGGEDIAARRTLLLAAVVHRLAELGGEHDILATLAEHVPQHGFRAAAPCVDVGGVEQRDPEVDGFVDDLARGLGVGALAEIVAADADGGDAQAGAAEITNIHDMILEVGRDVMGRQSDRCRPFSQVA